MTHDPATYDQLAGDSGSRQSGSTLELIAAIARSGVIGREGGLPWKVSSDLRRFRRLTLGSALIVGRKTYDSIGRPLPGRRMIVVSRRLDLALEGVEVAHSLGAALDLAASSSRAFCAGGAELYRQCLPHCQRMHLTWVESEVPGDVQFPEVDWRQWRVVSEIRLPPSERDEYATTFREYHRL